MWILDFLFFSALKKTAAQNLTTKDPPIIFDGTQVRSKRGSCIDRQACVQKLIYNKKNKMNFRSFRKILNMIELGRENKG